MTANCHSDHTRKVSIRKEGGILKQKESGNQCEALVLLNLSHAQFRAPPLAMCSLVAARSFGLELSLFFLPVFPSLFLSLFQVSSHVKHLFTEIACIISNPTARGCLRYAGQAQFKLSSLHIFRLLDSQPQIYGRSAMGPNKPGPYGDSKMAG